MNLTRQDGRHRGRRLRRSDLKGPRGGEVLPERHVEKWTPRFEQVAVPRVARDADDAEPFTSDLQSPANRIAVAPELCRHRGVDEGDWRRRLIVGPGELAAHEERDAHRGEV